MKSVKVYLWTTCPFCIRAVQLLKSKGIEPEIVNLDGDSEGLQKIRQQTGQRTVPQIFIGDEFIGGHDDLVALERSGQLDQKLNG